MEPLSTGTSLLSSRPHLLSRETGKPLYAEAAQHYADAFLERCIDEAGSFAWGNHIYYDAFEDKIVRFTGGYHEIRPITPAWELLWQQAPGPTEKHIRSMIRDHVYDPETGRFNRHDRGDDVHSFLESGGILAESAAWLFTKTDDPELVEIALKIAEYSHSHRGEKTGLIINQPDKDRWDAKVSTTEVGLWAQSLLRAYRYTSKEAFLAMAQSGMEAYLKYGYDESTGNYFGQLSVKNRRIGDSRKARLLARASIPISGTSTSGRLMTIPCHSPKPA